MRNAGLDEPQAGIKIAGRNINNLRYADDTTLMAESEEELNREDPLEKEWQPTPVFFTPSQQYSCLENPMDGGAWEATVHQVAKSRTRLTDFTFTFKMGNRGKRQG